MCVAGGQQAQAGVSGGVRHGALHQPFTQPAAAVSGLHIDVADPGKGDIVGDDAGQPDLPVAFEEGEYNAVLDGELDHFTRPSGRPVRGVEGGGDEVDVGALCVVGDEEFIFMPFHAGSPIWWVSVR